MKRNLRFLPPARTLLPAIALLLALLSGLLLTACGANTVSDRRGDLRSAASAASEPAPRTEFEGTSDAPVTGQMDVQTGLPNVQEPDAAPLAPPSAEPTERDASAAEPTPTPRTQFEGTSDAPIQGSGMYDRAEQRLQDYAYAIDHCYKEPEKIYAFMTADFKAQMSEEAFCEAFRKERSFPYITPLYIWQPEITLDESGDRGSATFLQAARIVGMTYTVSFVYENGDYYIEDWASFLDGSYLDKFEDQMYTLDWYYDTDALKDAEEDRP